MGALVGFAFMGWVPIIPQRGVPEDTLVSHACLYLQGLACGFVIFFSLFNIYEKSLGVVTNARSLKGKW